jgi:hypothetical protein
MPLSRRHRARRYPTCAASREPVAALELERLVDRALRDVPLEPAPATLHTRVLARIARGASPSRRGRYAEWPLAARALFVVAAALCAALGSLSAPWLASHLLGTTADARGTVPLSELRSSVADLVALLRALDGALPREWIYGGLAAATALYATLFALTAVSYRALTGAVARERHRS